MELTTSLSLIAGLVYLLAGILKGTIGIGFPTAVIAFMAIFVDVRTAILLAIIPMIVTNLWQVYRSEQFLITVKEVWPLALTMVVFLAIFSRMSSGFPIPTLSLFVGICIVVFAASSLWFDPPALSPRYKLPVQLLTGFLAGIMGGIAAIWAPPLVIYLSATRAQKEEFVATVGFLLLIGSMTLLITFWQSGAVTLSHAKLSTLLVVPGILGFMIGEKIRGHVNNDTFRKLMLWFFLLMGLNLLYRGLNTI